MYVYPRKPAFGLQQSVIEWVERLRKQGAILGFKSSEDPVPKGSDMAQETFALIIQTEYQREVFKNTVMHL